MGGRLGGVGTDSGRRAIGQGRQTREVRVTQLGSKLELDLLLMYTKT